MHNGTTKTNSEGEGPAAAVVGLGYVGLPLALAAEKSGWRVIGIDTDPARVRDINRRRAPFSDRFVQMRLPGSRVRATTSFSELAAADAILLCVPTPVHDDFTPDFQPLMAAVRAVGEYLRPGHLLVTESTVNPGTNRGVIAPLLSRISGLAPGRDFYLAHCPERINPGDPRWTVANIPRVVGGYDHESRDRAAAFYRSALSVQVTLMDTIEEAEAVKIVENSFRDVNIAFANELARSFDRLGIDAVRVIQGAATKPFAFLAHYPGSGVGGHCIPVDPYYLIQYAKKNGFHHRFLRLARDINNAMPRYTAHLLWQAFRQRGITAKHSRVAVLGLAYKAGIDDTRNSPALDIIELLRARGADVVPYDPYVPELSLVRSLSEAVAGADAAVIATAHAPFRELSPEFFERAGVSVVIDGQNCLAREAFHGSPVTYRGIGRGLAWHAETPGAADPPQRHAGSNSIRSV